MAVWDGRLTGDVSYKSLLGCRFHALNAYLKGRETALFSKSFLGDVFMPLMYILWAMETALFSKSFLGDVFMPLMCILRAGKRHFFLKASWATFSRPYCVF